MEGSSRPAERLDGHDRFDRCIDLHRSDVLAYALRRVADRHAADEVLAETFAVAWRRRDSIPDPPLPWLYGVARKVIGNQRRSLRRRLALRDRAARERTRPEPDPAETIADRDEIVRALARLSAKEREILMLVAWEGLDAAEGAVVLGCSPEAFRVRLHRARQALAKQLDDSGHSHSDGPQRAIETATELETR